MRGLLCVTVFLHLCCLIVGAVGNQRQKRGECSPPPKAPSRVSAAPTPSSCQEVSQSEKRLFVHVIDHFTLSQGNDCNLSILAALEPPLTWLEQPGGLECQPGLGKCLHMVGLAARCFSCFPFPSGKEKLFERTEQFGQQESVHGGLKLEAQATVGRQRA